MSRRTIVAAALALAGAVSFQTAHAQPAAGRAIALRFRYVAGQRVRLRSRTTQSMAGNEGALVTTAEHQVETVRVRPDGSAEQRLRVVRIDLTGPGIPTQVRESLATALSGAVIEFTQDVRGRVTTRRISGTVSDDARPVLDGVLESFDQMAAQLPEGPVPIGGTWTDRRPMRLALPGAQALEMSVDSTYTLRRITGVGPAQTAVLGVAMTIATPPGARVSGVRLNATGRSTGETTLALGQGHIAASRASGSMRMEMAVGARPVTINSNFEHDLARVTEAAPGATPPTPRARPRARPAATTP